MIAKRFSKNRLIKTIFGCLFAIVSLFSLAAPAGIVYADEEPAEEPVHIELGTDADRTTHETEGVVEKKPETGASCEDSLGELGWWVCPQTGKIAKAVDWLYDKIEDILVINPVEAKDGSPIYEIWKYARGITNIIFIIFLLVVIYSQLTGVGISNYGIKKVLPKLIVTAILVNLSFIICSLAVDVSNIVGDSIRGVFTAIEETTLTNFQVTDDMRVTLAEMYSALAGGEALAIGAAFIGFETGAIWMLIPVVLGAIVAVASGLITIALRQAVVILLIMIAPLAIVAYMLPNTEQWFKKWKQLFTKMLVFYPMFSLLFGASSLAGWAIIASASDGFGLLLGVAVQIFPLFFSWNLMRMSGTFLGTVNAKIRNLAAKPLASNRAWAESRRMNRRANTLANGITPSAGLMRYMEKRRALREEDTKNAAMITSGRTTMYVQRKIADSKIGDMESSSKKTSRYTRNAKLARNYSLKEKNAVSHTEHVLNNYNKYFDHGSLDERIGKQAQDAWIDYGRAAYLKDIDEENDINFLVDRYLKINERDENNNPKFEDEFNKYIRSVTGPNGEQRLMAKIIAQAAKVESKQRAEFNIMYAKWGHNGYNKRAFRDWIVGYKTNDDGWAVDENGKRLLVLGKDGKPIKDENGNNVPLEVVQGDALTKAPERLVLYDKRDENGLYYDFKDQNGNIIARVHRGIGDDGKNHDDAAFIKETLSNYDIPIADPINNIYSILAGVKAWDGKEGERGDINVLNGHSDIGLARYSTTIGRAMKEYKGNAAWAGSMFNSGIGNRQIKNSSQHAIWVLDSIVKTLKPGAFNTQNPASVEYVRSILDPNNWKEIFTEKELINAVNINNKLYGGENWKYDEEGNVVRRPDGEIDYETVPNPTYEQRLNTLKRKLLIPAMQKILPAFDRLRTSNTADNQKPGTADEQYKFLKMVQDRWEHNPTIPFDPTLVDQDLQSEARAFRKRKHDKDGNLIYDSASDDRAPDNLLESLRTAYDRAMTPEDLRSEIFAILRSNDRYSRALMRFDELCNENPDATMQEISNWFNDLDVLV